jgi:hypothetical protein
MADPVTGLTTVGMVSNFLHIIQFSVEVFRNVSELMKNSQIRGTIRIKRLADDVEKVCTNIKVANAGRMPLTAA